LYSCYKLPWRIEELRILLGQISLRFLLDKLHSQPRSVPDLDKTVFDDRIAQSIGAEKRSARPHIGTFLELSRKHGAKMYSELKTVAFVEQGLRKLYGLDAGEAW